jgi:ABC-type antimicrobial peptide transport system permease subunit
MKLRDIFSLCLQNLKRRKGRTFLTTLGVTIGCASILLMLSIGFGITEQQQKSIEELGQLTSISVSTWTENGEVKITDETLENFAAVAGVKSVLPKMENSSIPSQVFAGTNDRYSSWATISAIDFSKLEEYGFKLAEGSVPSPSTSLREIPVLIGSDTVFEFADSLRSAENNMINPYENGYFPGEGLDSLKPEGWFDPMKTSLKLVMSGDDPEKTFTQTLRAAGMFEGDFNSDYVTVSGIVMDLETYKAMISKYRTELGIRTKDPLTYSSATVIASSIEDVESVTEAINNMGYGTYSLEDVRKSMQESTRTLQLALGGIGAVSLLVAAIGIANTMIMSITERTREIGIMKAIGCTTKDIRILFLLEAGMIGLLGGIFGVLISYAISFLINTLTSTVPVTDLTTFIEAQLTYGGRLSVIPLPVTFFALIFCVFIGILFGYYPASRAVKISALEAIRRE